MSENFNGIRYNSSPLDDPFMKQIGMDKFRKKESIPEQTDVTQYNLPELDGSSLSPEDTFQATATKGSKENDVSVESSLPVIDSPLGRIKVKQATRLTQNTPAKDNSPFATDPVTQRDSSERIDLGLDNYDQDFSATAFHEARKSSGFEAKYKPLEGTEIIINQQNNLESNSPIGRVKKISINSALPSEIGKVALENEESVDSSGNTSRVNKANFESQEGNFKALVEQLSNSDSDVKKVVFDTNLPLELGKLNLGQEKTSTTAGLSSTTDTLNFESQEGNLKASVKKVATSDNNTNNRAEVSYKFSETDSVLVSQDSTPDTKKTEASGVAAFLGVQVKQTISKESSLDSNVNASSTSIVIPFGDDEGDSSKTTGDDKVDSSKTTGNAKFDSAKTKLSVDHSERTGEHSSSKVTYQNNNFTTSYASDGTGRTISAGYVESTPIDGMGLKGIEVRRNMLLEGTSSDSVVVNAQLNNNLSVNATHESNNGTSVGVEYNNGKGLTARLQSDNQGKVSGLVEFKSSFD